jgi:class 3 adenylate cyclase/tetratricopeptide (TPR) repeat protein
VDCPACGHPNRPEARFCGDCGAPLAESLRCPDCGTENPTGQRFCDGCGRQLSIAAPQAEAPPEPQIPDQLAAKIRADAGALEGERKQVTVLFADVVGSMQLASQIDPEAWRGVMARLFSLSCDAVHNCEGTVDKFTGDGMMAIFGAPIAHEDHARRGCYAALELQEALAAYAGELRSEQDLELAIRIGLNSGEVVVGAIGDDLEMDYTAIGHTVGLAQRAEQLAEPGKACLTEHTAALVEGYLELADRGEFEPKGAAAPLRIYELTGRSEATGRVEAHRGRGLSHFVGREAEMDSLESAREQSLAGQGQVVGVVGEAGVGKSRLCHEFAERCRERGMPVYHVAAQAHAKSVPLAPVLELLRGFFGIGERDPERLARRRIEEAVTALDPGLGEELPLLFEFLAVADPERPAERMDPEARQRRLLALLKRLARAQSAHQPGLMAFEDLHWLDTASETFLANHIEALQGTQSMLLVNFRPDHHAQWMSRSYYRQIALSPLGAEASERLLAELLGDDPSLDGLAELITERSEGNPFFIEEIVQSQVEEGSLLGERGAYRLVSPLEQVSVPASVQAVLAARIDRLGEREKAVLGAAAVIGREFSQPILEQVAGLVLDELEEALAELVSAEFVYLQELTPEPIYAFKHALTQQVAYDSQLEERRRALHAKAAGAIASGNPERLEERAALVAGHWEAAGEQLQAARWYARAAAWAGTGDPAAAFSHWQRVRELADELPESEESVGLGLAARTYLLGFVWRLGIGHEEAEALFDEGERIAERTGDVRWRALLLGGYGLFRAIDGELGEAAPLARQSIALAEECGDPGLYVALASQSMHPLALSGEIRESVVVADRAIELAGGDPSVGAGVLNTACPYAQCVGYRGFDLATLGELEKAGREIAQSREIAGEQGDAEVVGWTHLYSCWHGYLLGEAGTALGHARRAVEITERIGDSFARSWAWLFLGMAEVMRGSWKTAIEALERSREIYRELHVAVEAEPWRLAFLAEAHLGLGDNERAKEAAAEGVAIARSQGTVFGELVASLAQARVLLGADGPDARTDIEAALSRARELVRRMGSKAIEPHVHVDLAELARRSGDERVWREELSEAHRLFTEIGANGYAERVAGQLAGDEQLAR